MSDASVREYKKSILNLEASLIKLEASISHSVQDTANLYRVCTEIVCKATIQGAGLVASGDLNKLISDAGKIIEQRDGSSVGSVFRAHATFLRNIGNIYSHDSGDLSTVLRADNESILQHLAAIIKISFYGDTVYGDTVIDAPKLPDFLATTLSDRVIKRVSYEQIRSEEVVKLCYPRQKVDLRIERRDGDKNLVYDYVVALLGGGLSRGFLFLRSRSSIEKCLNDLIVSLEEKLPDSLSIVTPTIFRSTGGG